MSRAPHLRFHGNDAKAEAVVLLLPGGTEESLAPVRVFDHAVLRMVPFGRSVIRAGGGRITVATLRYRVRGWNGEKASPLPDARWGLGKIAKRFGHLPIGLVGHSMGGRLALRVADHVGDYGAEPRVECGGVHSVAALAPWLPDGEPMPLLGDRALLGERALLLAHGTADNITDPHKTTELAEKLAAAGGDVELVKVPGGRHDMLFPAKPWHDMVAGFMARTLLAQAQERPTDPVRH